MGGAQLLIMYHALLRTHFIRPARGLVRNHTYLMLRLADSPYSVAQFNYNHYIEVCDRC